MDTVRRMKLQGLRDKIVQDVDVEYVFNYLISKDVLSVEDMELIKAEKTRKDRARHLLDILLGKSGSAFEHFVESLKITYPWLSKQLRAEGPQSYQVEEKSYFDTLLLGGLPQPPPHNVERKEKMEEVRQHLHSLQRGRYVVLHGMTGSGKSCLAAAALDNKQLLIEKFKGAVYWIGVGDISSESSDDLLCHMTDLLEKLSHHPSVESEKHVQSSTSVKGARESLRRYFTSGALRDGLLILDDVFSPMVIDAFDIGCKILVTTKDSKVMTDVEGRHHLIRISKGFSEQESLCLMAKCAGVEISQLPPEAKKIHQLSKGVPMVIALIGAQLAEQKDDVQRNPGRWTFYLDKLTRHDYGCAGCINASDSLQGGDTTVRSQFQTSDKKIISPEQILQLPSLPTVESLSVQIETVRINSVRTLDIVTTLLDSVKTLQKEVNELKSENVALKIQMAEILNRRKSFVDNSTSTDSIQVSKSVSNSAVIALPASLDQGSSTPSTGQSSLMLTESIKQKGTTKPVTAINPTAEKEKKDGFQVLRRKKLKQRRQHVVGVLNSTLEVVSHRPKKKLVFVTQFGLKVSCSTIDSGCEFP